MASKKPAKKPFANVPSPKKAAGKRGDLKARADFSNGGYAGGVFSQFEGAKFSNKRQWVNTPFPADFKKVMTTYDRQELTRKMRWLSVNSGLVRQMISDYALYSVGDGIKAQPSTGDAAWDKLAHKYFNDWGNRPCEITNRYNFSECQTIVCKRIDIDGEIFVLKTFTPEGNPLLQLIESHRVGTTNYSGNVPEGLVDGIMFNKYGAVIGYNVIKSDGDTRLVSAPSMMHVHNPEQVTGARAYSPIQHSLNAIIDNLEMMSLEREAQKANADIVRTITKESGQFAGDVADFQAFNMRPQDYAVYGNNSNNVYNNPQEVGSFIGGKILALAPGEKLESHTSTRGNENFQTFMDFNNRDSSGGVLPYEFVCNPSEVSGSGVRLVTSKAQRQFEARQKVLIDRFCNPVYYYVISKAIANGELPPNDNFHRVNWVTTRKVTVDAGRDATANQRDIQMGLKTLSDHFAEQGMDFYEEVDRRIQEQKYILDKAKEAGVEPWRIYMPQNAQIPDIDGDISAQESAPEADDEGFTPLTK